MVAASFAGSLALDWVHRGGVERDLLVAFAGLVAVRDSQTAMDCLKALDGALSASAGSDEPSA